MASGEWGTLNPLADGSFQTVRGLSMKKIVGKKPDYKLRPMLADVKKRATSNELLQTMKIPTKLGGEVEILFGI